MHAIGIVCIGLIRHYNLSWGSGDKLQHYDRFLVGVTTVGGMLLVTIPTFLVYFFGDSIEKTGLEVLQNVVGMIMYIATGAMAIDNYDGAKGTETGDAGLAMGALSIINALAYAIDAFFAYRNRKAA
ncbi:unnamed protein product [Darwinula stevensoni]|uniref:Uncharacterized protein n=1 Tax=Darwinula stevensoni TaxID=69355 RepID=A0A7R9A020_9CRUS|nr:unnamed protein product [Darwinula stevensoni]CAG0880086.1 unnamed protein product [Darwinula stevensoni]